MDEIGEPTPSHVGIGLFSRPLLSQPPAWRCHPLGRQTAPAPRANPAATRWAGRLQIDYDACAAGGSSAVRASKTRSEPENMVGRVITARPPAFSTARRSRAIGGDRHRPSAASRPAQHCTTIGSAAMSASGLPEAGRRPCGPESGSEARFRPLPQPPRNSGTGMHDRRFRRRAIRVARVRQTVYLCAAAGSWLVLHSPTSCSGADFDGLI